MLDEMGEYTEIIPYVKAYDIPNKESILSLKQENKTTTDKIHANANNYDIEFAINLLKQIYLKVERATPYEDLRFTLMQSLRKQISFLEIEKNNSRVNRPRYPDYLEGENR